MQKYSYKKYMFVLLAAALMVSFSFAAAFSIQAESTASEFLNEIETKFWGRTYQQPEERRVERLEFQLYGQSREGHVNNRLQSLEDYILPDEAAPSLAFLLAYLENYHSITPASGPLLERLEQLEAELSVQPPQQAVIPRLHNLFAVISEENNFANPVEEAPAAAITLEPGMAFSVRLETDIDSGRSQTGKLIDFSLQEDFVVDGVLVLPAGTEGRMRLAGAESAGFLGRDGRLKLQDHSLESLDGQRLRFALAAHVEPQGFVDSSIAFVSRHRSRFLAAGAGVAGALILEHPGGLIFSFAVPGREEKYSQGEIVQLEITRETEVFGIPLDED